MAVDDNALRSSIWSEVHSLLTTASITTSDLSTSSISVNIGASYNNSKGELPKIVINPVSAVPEQGKVFYNSSKFDAIRLITVNIDIVTKKIPHLDQILDKVVLALEGTSIGGLPLYDYEEGVYFPADQNNNRIHAKTITFMFRR